VLSSSVEWKRVKAFLEFWNETVQQFVGMNMRRGKALLRRSATQVSEVLGNCNGGSEKHALVIGQSRIFVTQRTERRG